MAELSKDENRLNEAEQARREFMKAAGKLAIYTPPALMLLMRPSREAVAALVFLKPMKEAGRNIRTTMMAAFGSGAC